MKKSLDKPYDVWALGSDIWKIGKIPILGRYLLSKIVGYADRVFADGIELCRDVEEISGRQCEFLPSSRVLPIPGTVNKTFSDAGYLNLLFVGRYRHNKGPDILLQAFQRLPQRLKEMLRLKMYGFGPLKPTLIEFVAEHHLDHCVTISVGISAEELAEELSRAAYLVIPSRIESIPVVFSDALQMGTPVIATPAGDLKALVTEYGCGTLATDFSPEALASAIETACLVVGKVVFLKSPFSSQRGFLFAIRRQEGLLCNAPHTTLREFCAGSID